VDKGGEIGGWRQEGRDCNQGTGGPKKQAARESSCDGQATTTSFQPMVQSRPRGTPV